MPFWCGTWGANAGWWWIFPLLCVAAIAVFAFVCFRVVGCMGWRSARRPDETLAQLEAAGHRRGILGSLARPCGALLASGLVTNRENKAERRRARCDEPVSAGILAVGFLFNAVL